MDDLAVLDVLTNSKRLEADGFVVVPDAVVGDQCETLADLVQALESDDAGSRALLDQPWCVELANQLRRHSEPCALLPADAVAVQCRLFDKSPQEELVGVAASRLRQTSRVTG